MWAPCVAGRYNVSLLTGFIAEFNCVQFDQNFKNYTGFCTFRLPTAHMLQAVMPMPMKKAAPQTRDMMAHLNLMVKLTMTMYAWHCCGIVA